MEQMPAEYRETVSANPGLASHLAQIESGKDATPRSWLFEDQPAQAVLGQWLESISTLQSGSDFERRIFSLEQTQLEKWGPQGAIPSLEKSLPKILENYSERLPSPVFDSPEWKRAIESARVQLFGNRAQLRPSSLKKVVDDMRMRDTLSTNSGYPDYRRRSEPSVVSRAIEDASSGRWQGYPAIVLFRKYFGKLRQVWMFPMATNLVEGSFTQVIQAHLRRTSKVFLAPWEGFSKVREVISGWYRQPESYIFGGDFSRMDVHMRRAQMEQVYLLLAPAFQREHHELLHSSLMNAVDIGLLVSRTAWLPRHDDAHGLASGTNWTQLSETLFQFILKQYLEVVLGESLSMMAIGDDSATFAPMKIHPVAQRLVEVYAGVGMEANIEKQSDEPHEVTFLQRLFQRGYTNAANETRAVYPTVRALETSVFPERWHSEGWNENMFAVRQYMILENCIDHPLFESFVKFIVRGQKWLLPFAKASTKQLLKYTVEAGRIPSLISSYNQEKKDSSLADFASIALAKTL